MGLLDLNVYSMMNSKIVYSCGNYLSEVAAQYNVDIIQDTGHSDITVYRAEELARFELSNEVLSLGIHLNIHKLITDNPVTWKVTVTRMNWPSVIQPLNSPKKSLLWESHWKLIIGNTVRDSIYTRRAAQKQGKLHRKSCQRFLENAQKG